MKYIQLLFILPVLSFAQVHYDSSKISKEIISVINDIEKENILMSSAVGAAGSRPEQYDRFEKLKEKASYQELKMLTNHPNGVVKCYSFMAFCEIADNETIFTITKQHLFDEAIVETFFGCIMSDYKAGDIFLDAVVHHDEMTSGKLSPDQIKELDSLIINSGSKLYYRNEAIKRIENNESNYGTIRKLAVEEKNEYAFIKLAEYRKEKDIQIIIDFYKDIIASDDKDNLMFFYLAVAEYPHENFLPILKKELEDTFPKEYYNGIWADLYFAIASYKNEEALELLQQSFIKAHPKIKQYHLNYIENAVTKHYTAIYETLLWRLWEDENIINTKNYILLSNLHSDRAYKATTHTFVSVSDEYLQGLMMQEIKRRDHQLADLLITEGIRTANVHDIEFYLSVVKQDNNKKFVEPLFSRLKFEHNPHVYLAIISTLINYKNPDINKSILNARKANPTMNEGWGGDSLDTLLEKNDIKP